MKKLANNTETLGKDRAMLHIINHENARSAQKRRRDEVLAVNGPKYCQRKCLLLFELRNHGRIVQITNVYNKRGLTGQ